MMHRRARSDCKFSKLTGTLSYDIPIPETNLGVSAGAYVTGLIQLNQVALGATSRERYLLANS